MYIGFELYRVNGEMFDAGKVGTPVINDAELIKIDEVFLNLLDRYLADREDIKKYGRAYIGRVKILYLQITDEDTSIDFDETTFMEYISNIMPDVPIVWSKTNNLVAPSESTVKTNSEKK